MPCPFGIVDVPRSRIIDLDEAVLFVESGNLSKRKAHLTRRLRQVGPYGHSEKQNILVAILGEACVAGQQHTRQCVETWNDGGSTVTRFLVFILRILQSIGPGAPANWY